MKKISLIMPAYNEAKTLSDIVDKVFSVEFPEGWERELIIVNDGSKDNTLDISRELAIKYPPIKVVNNEINIGKSQSVRKGILESTGDFIVIQDADLEYDPNDLVKMLNVLSESNCDVVYGNRFGKANHVIYHLNYYGNKAVSAISNIFTYPRIKVWIPDMEVCYKLIRGDIAREIAKGLTAKSNFGFEPEITAKLARYKKDDKRLNLKIVPISYYPRSVAEGKKIKAFRDGTKALLEIIKFNLF